jgi:two-component system nitrogen regulation sensor histidine kinase GlnL
MTESSPGTDSALYGMILENIDRAVVAFDQEGRISLFNPAAEALMERSARQIIGKHYQELFKDQRTLLYLVNVALQEGRSITDDEGLYLHRPNAAPLPVNAYAAPIYTSRSNQDGAVMIIRDLSRKGPCVVPTGCQCWALWPPDWLMRSKTRWEGSRARHNCSPWN